MTFRGPEKMDEDTGAKNPFVVPSPPIHDSKPSFARAIQLKHDHRSTSTPYVGAFPASGCLNLKHNYDSGSSSICYTPVSRVSNITKYCGHQSFDTLSDVETHVDEPHPQLNLLSCFNEKAEEFPTKKADLGDFSIWHGRHPAHKRRSLQTDKSPSPRQNKRHSLDLSSDSGCFSTRTTRSDSNFSGDLPHLPFASPAMEDAGKSAFRELVCLAEQDSTSSLFPNSTQSFGVNMSGQSCGDFHSDLTPSVSKKVSRLQLVLSGDSGCSVTSMEFADEPTRNVHLNSTPSFGEKPLKLQPRDASGQAVHDIHLTSTLSKLQPVFPSDSECCVNTVEMSAQSTHDLGSKSTLTLDENVSTLQSSDSRHSVRRTDIGGCSSAPGARSASTQPFGNSRCNVDSRDTSRQSDSFHLKPVPQKQDFLTSIEKESLEVRRVSEAGCDVLLTMKQSRKQTFEERLALRNVKLDREIGHRIGNKYMDIIRELTRKQFAEPLGKIFSHLSEEELCSLCLVSRHWKSAVEFETNARLRRRKYIQENRQRMAETPQENRSKLVNPARQQNFTNSSKPMAVIQTVEELPSAKPVAPSLTKAEEFLKEARLLDRTETLRKCPRCDSPARANEKDRHARCTKCQFEFCVCCRNPLHSGRNCVKYIRNPAPAKIGSKQSKQNLRRL